MTGSGDLSARITRLEHLLDALQEGRTAGAGGSPDSPAASSALDRIVDIVALLQQRVTRADWDDGDAIAMRALLEEFSSITASLRELALDVEQQLGAVGAAVDDSHARLTTLEEIK